jgi:hypothetical protein
MAYKQPVKLWPHKLLICLTLCCLLFAGASYRPVRLFKSSQIEIRKENGRFCLYREGQPYFIKGAAVTDLTYLHKIREYGGNSIRTYSAEQGQQLLDSAHSLGLTVMMGLDIGKAGKEFDPGNPQSVELLKKKVRKEVLALKDHPALLIWGLGNEVHLFLDNGATNLAKHIQLWRVMNELAAMIHELDPLHPVTTVVPRKGAKTNFLVQTFCGNIDLFSFNSSEPFDEGEDPAAIVVPYLVSEISAPGFWNCPRTDWYAHLEPTSAQKIAFIGEQYKAFQEGNSMGNYAFYWGQKQEYTSTWFSLFTERGEETDVALAFKDLWTGKENNRSAITISHLTINRKKDSENIYLEGGTLYPVKFDFTIDHSNLAEVKWELQQDDVEYLDASYKTFKKKVVAQDSSSAALLIKKGYNSAGEKQVFSFTMATPQQEGAYRLLLSLKNSEGIVSTANTCFYVRNKSGVVH